MNRKNSYGTTTITKCAICYKENAITINSEGLECCRLCKNKKVELKCPICKNKLEIRKGKYGAYFQCWSCNQNWSKSKIMRWIK